MIKKYALPLCISILLLIALSVGISYWRYITPHYAVSSTIAADIIIPPPPAPGSPAEQADIAAVLKAQEARTPEDVLAAQADDLVSVFRFMDVIDPTFTADNLPLTTAFFERVRHDEHLILEVLKSRYDRPRPYATNSAVELQVKKPFNTAYPSGHTSFGFIVASLLAQMVPEKKQAILARADVYGRNRVIGGAHYPSDVAAGRIAGLEIAARLMGDAQFREDFIRAKAELRSKLGY